MESLITFIQTYQLIIIPITVMIIAQLIKIVIEWAKGQPLDLRHPHRYGGMPSSHAAVVIGTTILVGILEGVGSTYFALTVLLAFLVIRDALGLRAELSKHGAAINHLMGNDDQSERVGHTVYEVIAGMLVGAILAPLLWWIVQLL